MRILIANHHLEQRAGSELYCLELATALHRFGHQVALFTFITGEVSESARAAGVAVFSPQTPKAIEDFEPEVIHVHHAPCLFYLAGLKLRAPVVFSSLGWIPPMEAAPPVFDGVAAAVAVSEEVREQLASTPLGGSLPVQLVPNWFNDLEIEQQEVSPPRQARRVAVVTNHLDETLRQDLDAISSSERDLEWSHFGSPSASVVVNEELLSSFDRVITIGRTVLLAGALGVPCLVYDIHGSDGLLTPDSLDLLAGKNFSGRTHRLRPSRDKLRDLLLDDALRIDTATLSRRIWSEYRLSQRAKEWVQIYQSVVHGATRLSPSSPRRYGALGTVHAELVAELTKYKTSNTTAWDQLNLIGEELTYLRKYAASLESQLQERRFEGAKAVAAVTSELRSSQERAQHLEARCEHLEQLWAAHTQSLSGKSIQRFRDLKDQIIPHGHRSRRIYDKALKIIKHIA